MKRFNFNQLIWLLILLGFLISIGFLLFSGKIFLLVAERTKIYIILTLVFFLIMLVMQIAEVFTVPSRGGIKKGYIFFILIIITFIIVSNIDILKNSLIMKGVVVEHNNHHHGSDHIHHYEAVDKEDNIIVKKDNFHNIIESINENIESFADKEIAIEGLFYEDEVQIGDYVITQIDMNCCMVDSSFLGITCIGEADTEIKTGDYVKGKGKIKIVEHNGHKLGAIEIKKLEKINK